MLKVAMLGVGKLGEPCATVMSKHYDVVGYDVSPRLPTFPMKSSIAEAIKDRDFIFIAAPTPHDPIYGGETPTCHLPVKDFDYSTTVEILKEVNKYATKDQLVVLISTVLPGTVRNRLRKHITNARFIYNPYLIAMGTVAWDFVNPEMIIIGTEDGSVTGDAKELIDFYKPMMENNPRYEVGTWDEAESIKIFYNTFISTKLALVNMIQDVAETNGNINVDVVTQALANSTHRIMGPAYMKAGMGDAGACHPRDNIALRFLADRLDLGYDLFDAIMRAREVQAKRLAEKCMKYGKRITIIGKAYKPSVPYVNGSYSLLVGHYIEEMGGHVHYYDINTGDVDFNADNTEVYLIGYWETWVENIDWKSLNKKYTIIDPWRIMRDMDNHTVIHYGNTRNKDQSESMYQLDTFDTVKTIKMVPPVTPSATAINTTRLKGGVLIKYPLMLDGGGLQFRDDLIRVVKEHGKPSYNHGFEWCAGFGVLGYEMLGLGFCNRLTFSDYYDPAIEVCLDNAKMNNLSNYVDGYVTPTISGLPKHLKFDLVVSNPPHCVDYSEFVTGLVEQGNPSNPDIVVNSARLCVDQDWSVHREFFENIKEYLTTDADIFLIESANDHVFKHMATLYGFIHMNTYKMLDPTMPNGIIMHFKPI